MATSNMKITGFRATVRRRVTLYCRGKSLLLKFLIIKCYKHNSPAQTIHIAVIFFICTHTFIFIYIRI